MNLSKVKKSVFFSSARFLAFAVVAVVFSEVTHAEGYQVIVNDGVKTTEVDRDSLRFIFSGEKVFWGANERIVAFHGDVHSSSMSSFLKDVLNQDSDQFLAGWRRKLFSGRGIPPHSLASDDEVLEGVAKTKGAIGIVSSGMKIQSSVKALKLSN